jgi:hypothetical protein
MNAGPGNTISAMPSARTVTPITATATLRCEAEGRSREGGYYTAGPRFLMCHGRASGAWSGDLG